MIQVIHTTTGRARYKVEELYRSESLKEYLERSLTTKSEIESVSANPLTSNLLVKFNGNNNPSIIASFIEEIVKDYQNQNGGALAKSLPTKTGKKKASRKKESKKPVADAQDQKVEDWHFMDVSAVLDKLQTSQEAGLSSEAAAEKLNKYGPNVLSETETRSDISILIDQFKSLPVALLGVAAGVSVLTGGLIDAVVILGVVGVNAAIGYFTESQSERVINSLRSSKETFTTVIRDGKRVEISTEDVVPGDIIVLKPGGYVAADARLIDADNLSIDESALTGESIPVNKTVATLSGEDIALGDRTNMAYMGTLVTGGQGLAVVVGTGQFTEMGQIQQMVGEAVASETPLSRQLDEVGSQLVTIGMVICGGVFGIGVLRGYGLLQMLQSSISLAVAAVPEGLPTIATTTLALGIQDMRKHNVLVRSLSAVEALGSVQTICLDKTGTITENRMTVVEVYVNEQHLKVSDGKFVAGDKNINPYNCDELLKLIHVSILCNESQVNLEQDGEYSVKGSATENALIYMGIAAGVNVKDLREKYSLLQTNLRSENRNIMSTVHSTKEQHKKFVAVKGSPREVAQKCKWWLRNGELTPLTDEDMEALEIENDRMAGKALRVLGVAYTHVENDNGKNGNGNGYQSSERDLTWLGIVGMADPIRKGATNLMQDFHQAGIDTVMITGDQSPTAYAIAKQLKLSRDEELEILDSSNLNNLSPEALTALADKVNVFARISPSNKLQIVQALQGANKVIAMTGDGINDAPALKAANVGVAMGKGGTDVAREVADIILEDDRLETMIIAVSQGRTIYNNIRKSVHFLLATNLSEIIVMTASTAAGFGEPLNALQLLWLNLVSDIFPGLSLALEPPEPDVLSRPPRNPDEPIVKNSDFGRIAFEAGTMSVTTLAAYGYGLMRYGATAPQASTLAFMSLTSAQLLHTLSCRSEQHSIFSKEKLPNNPYLNAAVLGSFALQFLAIGFPPLRALLKIAPIDPIDSAVIVASALLPLLVNETTKEIQISRLKNQNETALTN
ncbi:MAG: HAD-IC family P-type ATPase [Scytonema sp. PMC 1069.18]|nr:HAD-IC family P-type ATPase [Scytonema sp. PMC 1069.18]MEC4886719.1 HAD-IC family P-type ATPase [Scytonema sp. PMC 1070.18]